MSGDLCVDDDEQFIDVELSDTFTLSALDTDQHGAIMAAAELNAIYSGITRLWCKLETIERALRISEQTSDRARRTRAWVREALGGLEYPVFRGLDEACFILQHGGDHAPPDKADKPYLFTMPSAVQAIRKATR